MTQNNILMGQRGNPPLLQNLMLFKRVVRCLVSLFMQQVRRGMSVKGKPLFPF